MTETPAIDRDAAAALMEPLTDIVVQAGAAILAVSRATMLVEGKSDGSPVTEADMAGHRLIADGPGEPPPGNS
ncbi:MAG TPA: 3'(2'),5'-bisphosphate nucleotidase CysQ, partial [Afipia sp.]|nr:3'(2'),5'-bisphosphate nucleotidase CysQ [Afipia sp.]